MPCACISSLVPSALCLVPASKEPSHVLDRHHRHRRRSRRLHCRSQSLATRCQRLPDRALRSGRHLPEPWLHPDQDPSAQCRDHRGDRPGGQTRHRHCRSVGLGGSAQGGPGKGRCGSQTGDRHQGTVESPQGRSNPGQCRPGLADRSDGRWYPETDRHQGGDRRLRFQAGAAADPRCPACQCPDLGRDAGADRNAEITGHRRCWCHRPGDGADLPQLWRRRHPGRGRTADRPLHGRRTIEGPASLHDQARHRLPCCRQGSGDCWSRWLPGSKTGRWHHPARFSCPDCHRTPTGFVGFRDFACGSQRQICESRCNPADQHPWRLCPRRCQWAFDAGACGLEDGRDRCRECARPSPHL